tara:strand:- start:414 stop:1496 length:1083 start_codon:yes stop_codon:yes gene_type:complete
MEKDFKEESQEIRDAKLRNYLHLFHSSIIDENTIVPEIQAVLTQETPKGIRSLSTLGNVSTLAGKSKARKSHKIIMILKVLLAPETLFAGMFKSNLPDNKRVVLYFDTEQAKGDIKAAYMRVKNDVRDMIVNLKMVDISGFSIEDRIGIIESAIKNTPNVGYVVIDGIRDLVKGINDEVSSYEVTQRILILAKKLDIHILSVLHFNKNDNNLRGHIGTEMLNKSEIVWELTSNENGADGTTSVKFTNTRRKEPQNYTFKIVDGETDSETRVQIVGKPNTTFELNDSQLEELIRKVFSNDDGNIIDLLGYSYSELTEKLIEVYTKEFSNKLAVNRAKNYITQLKDKGIINLPISRGKYYLN